MNLLQQRQAVFMAIAGSFGGDEGHEAVTQWVDTLCDGVDIDPPSGVHPEVGTDDLSEDVRQQVLEIERQAAEQHKRRSGR